MQNMKWTAEDEQRFQEQSRRREAAIKARELPIKALIDKHFGAPAFSNGEKLQIFAVLTEHADDFRDVLAPFDSGVRPAAPQPLTPAAIVPTCPAPMPSHLWQTLHPELTEWPEAFKPAIGSRFEVKLRNGHVIHEIPDTLTVGWALINDPSDIIAWRYV